MRVAHGRVPTGLGDPLERVVARVGDALDQRRQDLTLITPIVACIAGPRTLSPTQCVERYVTRNAHDPRTDGFAFA